MIKLQTREKCYYIQKPSNFCSHIKTKQTTNNDHRDANKRQVSFAYF